MAEFFPDKKDSSERPLSETLFVVWRNFSFLFYYFLVLKFSKQSVENLALKKIILLSGSVTKTMEFFVIDFEVLFDQEKIKWWLLSIIDNRYFEKTNFPTLQYRKYNNIRDFTIIINVSLFVISSFLSSNFESL